MPFLAILTALLYVHCHSHTQSSESEAKPKVWVNAYKFIFMMLKWQNLLASNILKT